MQGAAAASAAKLTPKALRYRDDPGLFLPCACPATQGCECGFYVTGCGGCKSCTRQLPFEATHRPPCELATGNGRIRIGPSLVLGFPHTLLRRPDLAAAAVCRTRRDLVWGTALSRHLLASIAEERAIFEAEAARVSCVLMSADDPRTHFTIRSAASRQRHEEGGIYIDVDVVHGGRHQTQRVRLDVALPPARARWLQAHAAMLQLGAALDAIETFQRRIVGATVTRLARGCLGRRRFQAELEAQLRQCASIEVQRVWRSWTVRNNFFVPLRDAARALRRKRAAIDIQRVWRSHDARRPWLRWRGARRMWQRLRLGTRLAAAWRGWRCRRGLSTALVVPSGATAARGRGAPAVAGPLCPPPRDVSPATAGVFVVPGLPPEASARLRLRWAGSRVLATPAAVRAAFRALDEERAHTLTRLGTTTAGAHRTLPPQKQQQQRLWQTGVSSPDAAPDPLPFAGPPSLGIDTTTSSSSSSPPLPAAAAGAGAAAAVDGLQGAGPLTVTHGAPNQLSMAAAFPDFLVTPAALKERLRRDIALLSATVARQTAGQALVRSGRQGTGKWSLPGSIGTQHMRRHFVPPPPPSEPAAAASAAAVRPDMTTFFYAPLDPLAGTPAVRAAMAPLTRGESPRETPAPAIAALNAAAAAAAESRRRHRNPRADAFILSPAGAPSRPMLPTAHDHAELLMRAASAGGGGGGGGRAGTADGGSSAGGSGGGGGAENSRSTGGLPPPYPPLRGSSASRLLESQQLRVSSAASSSRSSSSSFRDGLRTSAVSLSALALRSSGASLGYSKRVARNRERYGAGRWGWGGAGGVDEDPATQQQAEAEEEEAEASPHPGPEAGASGEGVAARDDPVQGTAAEPPVSSEAPAAAPPDGAGGPRRIVGAGGPTLAAERKEAPAPAPLLPAIAARRDTDGCSSISSNSSAPAGAGLAAAILRRTSAFLPDAARPADRPASASSLRNGGTDRPASASSSLRSGGSAGSSRAGGNRATATAHRTNAVTIASTKPPVDNSWLNDDGDDTARRAAAAPPKRLRAPTPPPPDVDTLLAERPLPDEFYHCVDGPIVATLTATREHLRDFVTLDELRAAAARKAELRCFTAPLEETAALVVAAGLVDAAVDTVAAYMQHLLVSTRTLNATLARLVSRVGTSSSSAPSTAPLPASAGIFSDGDALGAGLGDTTVADGARTLLPDSASTSTRRGDSAAQGDEGASRDDAAPLLSPPRTRAQERPSPLSRAQQQQAPAGRKSVLSKLPPLTSGSLSAGGNGAGLLVGRGQI